MLTTDDTVMSDLVILCPESDLALTVQLIGDLAFQAALERRQPPNKA